MARFHQGTSTASASQVIAIGADIWVNMLTGQVFYSTDDWTTQTDIITTMDTDAEFWRMELGDNEIEWTSTSGTPAALLMYHAWNYLAI